MDKREKVIEGLDCCLEGICEACDYKGSDAPGGCKDELMYDALELLKAQEAVEPIVEKNISSGECEDPWGRLFFCGACRKRINEKYSPDEDDKFCKHCGQAVKWE